MTQAASTSSTPAFRDWEDAIDNPPKAYAGDQESLFLKLKPRPESYKLRPVAKPVLFRKHWKAFESLVREDGKRIGGVISPAVDAGDMHLDKAWSEGGYQPDLKCGELFINRDSGRLCVCELGSGVFKPMLEYQKETGNSIYGDNAPEWSVKVKKVPTKGGGEKTEYTVVRLDPVALTDEEKQNIANFAAKKDWREFFRAVTSEAIAELYDRLPENLKKAPKREKTTLTSSKPAAPARVAAAAPAPAKPVPVAQAAPVAKPAEKAPAPATQAPAATIAEDPNDTSWAAGEAAAGDQAQF